MKNNKIINKNYPNVKNLIEKYNNKESLIFDDIDFDNKEKLFTSKFPSLINYLNNNKNIYEDLIKEKNFNCSNDSIPLWLICIRSLSNWRNFAVNLSPIINEELKNKIIEKKSNSENNNIKWLLIINPNNIHFINDNYYEQIYKLFHYILNAELKVLSIKKTIIFEIKNIINEIIDSNESDFNPSSSNNSYEHIIKELLNKFLNNFINQMKNFKNLIEESKTILSKKKKIYILDEKEYNNDDSLKFRTIKEIKNDYEKMVGDCNYYNYLIKQNKTNDNLFIQKNDFIYSNYYKKDEVIYKGSIFSYILHYREVEPIKKEEYIEKNRQIEKEKIEIKINHWLEKILDNLNDYENIENKLNLINTLIKNILNIIDYNILGKENYVQLITEGNILLENLINTNGLSEDINTIRDMINIIEKLFKKKTKSESSNNFIKNLKSVLNKKANDLKEINKNVYNNKEINMEKSNNKISNMKNQKVEEKCKNKDDKIKMREILEKEIKKEKKEIKKEEKEIKKEKKEIKKEKKEEQEEQEKEVKKNNEKEEEDKYNIGEITNMKNKRVKKKYINKDKETIMEKKEDEEKENKYKNNEIENNDNKKVEEKFLNNNDEIKESIKEKEYKNNKKKKKKEKNSYQEEKNDENYNIYPDPNIDFNKLSNEINNNFSNFEIGKYNQDKEEKKNDINNVENNDNSLDISYLKEEINNIFLRIKENLEAFEKNDEDKKNKVIPNFKYTEQNLLSNSNIINDINNINKEFIRKELIKYSEKYMYDFFKQISLCNINFNNISFCFVLDCSLYLGFKTKIINLMILLSLLKVIEINDIKYSILISDGDNNDYKIIIKNYDEKINVEDLIEKIYEYCLINENKNNIEKTLIYAIKNLKCIDKRNNIFFVFCDSLDESIIYYNSLLNIINNKENSFIFITEKTYLHKDEYSEVIGEMWKKFEAKIKSVNPRIKIINCDIENSKNYIIENIFEKISSFLNNAFYENNNYDIDINEKIIREDLDSNKNKFKMKDIEYFERLLNDQTYKNNKYNDKLYFFNYKKNNVNFKINSYKNINKKNVYDLKNDEIKDIPQIKAYTSKIKNSFQDKSLIDSIFYPNKATKKQLSTKGTEIDIMALILYALYPVQEPMIYLEEKGGMIRDYSISIIIDNSKSCFSIFNEKHSYLTIINLLKIINSMAVPSFDLIITGNENLNILVFDKPSITIFKNDAIFEKLLILLSNPIANTDLSKSIQAIYDLKKMKKTERESYLFILTDGLPHKYNEKKINFYIKLCQNIGIKVFGIGLGIYPLNAKEIFESFIYSVNPENLLKIISKIFGKTVKTEDELQLIYEPKKINNIANEFLSIKKEINKFEEIIINKKKSLRIKKHTNFEEVLEQYKKLNINNEEEEKIIKELEKIYKYYKDKQKIISKKLDESNKLLFKFRIKKTQEMIQIQKILEMETNILCRLIDYHKDMNQNNENKENYIKIIEIAKKLLSFQKKEESKSFKRDPELDKIKIFDNSDDDDEEEENETKNENKKYNKNIQKASKYNTILKTVDDPFRSRRDCHLIKNNVINFIPKIEINFSDEMKDNYITKEFISSFKEELKQIFGNDKFNIIEINKGSIHILITLQFIFDEIQKQSKEGKNDIKEKFKNNNLIEYVKKYEKKLKGYKFCQFGTKGSKNGKYPEFVKSYVQDIGDSKEEILKLYNENKGEKMEDINLYEASKSFSLNDFNETIEYLGDVFKKQEHDIIHKNFSVYFDVFEEYFEKALALTVFEYQLIYIYTLDRDDYHDFEKKIKELKETKIQGNQNNTNVSQQYLFHGTKKNFIISILKEGFDMDKCQIGKFGKGAYFSDSLDVSYRYSKRSCNIPQIGDSFPVLICDTFYLKDKFEFYDKKNNGAIERFGVTFGIAGAYKESLKLDILDNYKKFIQNEYLFKDKDQFKPLYGVLLRRVKFLIIWRDINFDPKNPNKYNEKDFKNMLEFNKEMKAYAYREINTKIYYCSSTEEALKLIDRKKYNKIILITNAGNNGEQFLKEARRIIGGNTIALVSCYLYSNHIDWVKKLPNTFLSSRKGNIFQEFIKISVLEDKGKMEELKKKIEGIYDTKFKIDENLFKFKNFKNEGSFSELEFKPEYNKENHYYEEYINNKSTVNYEKNKGN